MKKILVIFIALTLVSGMLFAFGSKDEVVITGVADLDGKKIGVQAGTTGEMWVQDNVAGVALSSFKSGIDAALDLKNGAIDAVVLDELPAREIVSKNSDLMIITDRFAREEYAIAVKKGNADLLAVINETIEDLQATGGYEDLVLAFMPTDGNIIIPTVAMSATGNPVKLGTNAAFPPFEYVEGTKVVGFDITMGEYIAAQLGQPLEVVDMAFDSLIAALDSGVVDFVAAGMSITEERQKNVDFSVPYYESEQVIIVRK
ncbi:MAG: transporter substrate-binding domain-containing protein [Spirochaetales bacterium]